MIHDDDSGITLVAVKLFLMWLVSKIAHNYHEIVGNILITLSVLYLVWKWRRDHLKEKKK